MMTENEKKFVEKWNEMLKAAKEMEADGVITTSFAFELRSNNIYTKERRRLQHELNGCFIENDYRIETEAQASFFVSI